MDISLKLTIVAKEAVINCRDAFTILEYTIKQAALGSMSAKEHEYCWEVYHCVLQEVMNFIGAVEFDTDAGISAPKIVFKLRH